MITQAINGIRSKELMNSTTNFQHQHGETFNDVLQSYLNSSHHSRSPKIEVTGVLVPYEKSVSGCLSKFKIDSKNKEYSLHMNEDLERIARKLEWDEVTVKGQLDLYTNIIEVEKINPKGPANSFAWPIVPDPGDDQVLKCLYQDGRLEPVYGL